MKTRPGAVAFVVALAFVLACFIPAAASSAHPRSGGLSITILLPVNGTVVKGDVTIFGNASGPEGVKLSVQLSIDGGPWYGVDGGQSWSWLWSTFAFSDGLHSVAARVQGGGAEYISRGVYDVANKQPLYVLRNIFPPGDNIPIKAGDMTAFSVALDPSPTGSVLFNWFVDDEPVKSSADDWYNYTARPDEPGNHTLEVRVSADGATKAVHAWNISVRPLAGTPFLTGSGPEERDIAVFQDQTVRFNVSATDPQGKGLTYRWYYDTEPAPGNATGRSISVRFNSTGGHIVEVLVSNGETNTTVRWNVTVDSAPELGLLDLMPCTVYIVIGLFLGIWHGRRTRVQGSGSRVQGGNEGSG